MNGRPLLFDESGLIPMIVLAVPVLVGLLVIGIAASLRHGYQPSTGQLQQSSNSPFDDDASRSFPIQQPVVGQPGVPVVTTDGNVAIPVAPWSQGIPVPAADGTIVIPVIPPY